MNISTNTATTQNVELAFSNNKNDPFTLYLGRCLPDLLLLQGPLLSYRNDQHLKTCNSSNVREPDVVQSVQRLSYGLDDRCSTPGRGDDEIFSLRHSIQSPPGLPIQRAKWALKSGLKRLGREADYSAPSSAEVKNAWSYISTPQYLFLAWCFVKEQGQL